MIGNQTLATPYHHHKQKTKYKPLDQGWRLGILEGILVDMGVSWACILMVYSFLRISL